MTEGIILLDKPAGQTSFQSLGFLKRRLGTGRIGHAGTLDKFAEGLLIVLAGRMTRLCPLATSLDKEYSADFTFGRGTDTLDPEGATTGQGPVPSRGEIEAALPGFRGAISQVPPAYSAIHVDGRRASEAARGGEEVALRPREVRIDRLDLVEYRPPTLSLRISCSKGTYVRSLARDIAERLGTCAYVSRLRRTRIGGFSVDDARAPEEFDAAGDILSPAVFFRAVPALGRLVVKQQWQVPVSRGIRLDPALFEDAPAVEGTFGVFASDQRLVAVIEKSPTGMSYLAAFPEPGAEEATRG
ncbi:MAG: tRNA pseudouridine(55) synthase TruB [Spirochaetia bacterium]